MPSFVTDLYRDLRDRRLLLPAVALLLGLIAVPVALSKSADTVPPPPAAAPAKATAAEPAVLAEQMGIRNYRKRLERFKTKDPFQQQFQLPEATSSALEDVPASGGVAGGSAAEASSTSATSSSGTASTTGTVGSGTATSGAPEPAPSRGGTVTRRITRLVTRKVDVKIGPSGDVKKVDDVGQLDLLPDVSAPVVAFLGVSDDGKRAAFLVSTDVSSATGDGACVPDPTSCQFITMRPRDVEQLVYAPDGLTYKLKLLNIHEVKVKDG